CLHGTLFGQFQRGAVLYSRRGQSFGEGLLGARQAAPLFRKGALLACELLLETSALSSCGGCLCGLAEYRRCGVVDVVGREIGGGACGDIAYERSELAQLRLDASCASAQIVGALRRPPELRLQVAPLASALGGLAQHACRSRRQRGKVGGACRL